MTERIMWFMIDLKFISRKSTKVVGHQWRPSPLLGVAVTMVMVTGGWLI